MPRDECRFFLHPAFGTGNANQPRETGHPARREPRLVCAEPRKMSGFFTVLKGGEAQSIVLFMKKVSAHKLL
jgi:hypothetical protein